MNSENAQAGTSHAWRWLIVFLMLFALTSTSFVVGASSLMTENRQLGQCLMLVISFLKAMLVVVFFMHFWWEKAWKYLVTIPALMMAVILAVTLIPDIGFRTERYSSWRSRFSPAPRHTTNQAHFQEKANNRP